MESPISPVSITTELRRIREIIEDINSSSIYLYHRLDTIQALIKKDEFEFSNIPLEVAPRAKAKHVRELLEAVGIQEEGLTVGTFLNALNTYLIHKDLVDLNDLQIILSPLLAAAFQKPMGLGKVPYPLLLKSLSKMFV